LAFYAVNLNFTFTLSFQV